MFEADRMAGTTRWGVVRMRNGSKTTVTLLSSSFFALTTHWTGQTVPCSGEDCALCEFSAARGYFYVAIHQDGRTGLLELSAVAASNFEQHCRLMHGGMRPGLVFDVSRSTERRPVYTEVKGFKEGALEVDKLDLAAHVMVLYKFPFPKPGEDIEQYESRIRQSTIIRNRRLAEQMKRQLKPTY